LSVPTVAAKVAEPAALRSANPMRTRRQATIRDLRLAIDCLPRRTRIAMLDGLNSNEIIVGAYSTDGGICPMLAAHRSGGRTSFISFARAWDRFAFRDAHSRDARSRGARRATERELLILRTHLEASLLEDEGPTPDLGAAVAAHLALMGDAEAKAAPDAQLDSTRSPRPGDPDRSRELRGRPGWAWLRVFRRYDDYERALERLRPGSGALDHAESGALDHAESGALHRELV
jgi:hypothetical protein